MGSASRTVLIARGGGIPKLSGAADRILRWRPGAVPSTGIAPWLLSVSIGDAPLGWLTETIGPRTTIRTTSEVTSLYVAEGPDIVALSTHAVDAALGAFPSPAVDPVSAGAIAILGFAPGSGTALMDVQALPVGTVVTVEEGRLEWSAPPTALVAMDPTKAAAHARDALWQRVHTSLDSGAALCLTSGLDSRVLAAIASGSSREVPALTWGKAEDPDVIGAEAIARYLGFAHQRLEITTATGAEVEAVVAEELRVSEGVRPPLPPGGIDGLSSYGILLTGAGGETGRAFYTRWGLDLRPRPRTDHLIEAIFPPEAARLLRRDVADAIRDRIRHALALAQDAGFSGWAACDFFYATERLTHWGRAMTPSTNPVVGGFLHPQVQQGLINLSAVEKRDEAFHRGILGDQQPQLLPGPRPKRRANVPAVLRRVAERVRPDTTSGWALAPLVSTHPESAERLRNSAQTSQLAASVLASTQGHPGDLSPATFGISGVVELERALAATSP